MSTDNRESRPRTVTDDELTPGPGRRGTRSPVSCHDRRPDLRITMFELEPRQTTPAGANARNIDDEQACEAAHQLSQGRAAGTFAAETATPHEGGNTHAATCWEWSGRNYVASFDVKSHVSEAFRVVRAKHFQRRSLCTSFRGAQSPHLRWC